MKIFKQLQKEFEANAKNEKLKDKSTFLDGILAFPIFMLLGFEILNSSFVSFHENYWYFSLGFMALLWLLAYYILIRFQPDVTIDFYKGTVLILSVVLAFWTVPKALHYLSIVNKQEICFKAKVLSKTFSHAEKRGNVSFDSCMRDKIHRISGIGAFEYEEVKKNRYISVCGTISEIGFNPNELRGYWEGEERVDKRFITKRF